jgi:hypothetical protein
LTACANCGRELPEGAFFCPDCGTSTVTFSAAHAGVSPSHFNSGITATSPPLTAEPGAPPVDTVLPPPQPSPEERRPRLGGRRGLVLAVIAILAVLLVGTTFEAGMLLGSGTAPAVNSPSDPLSGGQLYAAYSANLAQATASYTNKTVYIQDSLDAGVFIDNSGQSYSSVDSGNVVLFWSSQAQLSGLSAGSTVLAKCWVNGEQLPPGDQYLSSVALGPVVVLENCALVNTQSQSAASVSVSQAYD